MIKVFSAKEFPIAPNNQEIKCVLVDYFIDPSYQNILYCSTTGKRRVIEDCDGKINKWSE